MNVDIYALIGEMYVQIYAAKRRIAELEALLAPQPEADLEAQPD